MNKEALRRYERVNTSWPVTGQITVAIWLGAHEPGIDAGPADGCRESTVKCRF